MNLLRISEHLQRIYPNNYKEALEEIICLVEKWKRYPFRLHPSLDQTDVIMITYGDSIVNQGDAPLKTLHRFMKTYVKSTIKNIHILPMFPYTSDDGFSVVDYREINPSLGSWDEVQTLNSSYNLMFDAVVNHASTESSYFKKYIADDPEYADFFIDADPDLDYSQVTRPRALPLLTPFPTQGKVKNIWTSFSSDQVDFNFKNPKVLIEILDILLYYTYKNARFIRLDAIGLLWKELGTSCMHLFQTHEIVKLMRRIINLFNNAVLVTETNVPHRENIRYFGNGHDEATLVYQFPLPPLTMHAFLKQDATMLSSWLDSIDETSNDTSFLNILATHDGIGLRPVEDVLSDEDKQLMVEHCLSQGGAISYKTTPTGREIPYELNLSYIDAITSKNDPNETKARKFLAAHALLLSIVGIPAIYIHSLIGSTSDFESVKSSGINRRINRKQLKYSDLQMELENKDSLRNMVLYGILKLVRLRAKQDAFHPNAQQHVLHLHPKIIAFTRQSHKQKILVLINVSDQPIEIEHSDGLDLISRKKVGSNSIINPYEVLWIDKSLHI